MKVTVGQIIWSADVTDEELRRVVKARVLPQGTIIKLDRLFFEKYGKEMIAQCQDAGYPVFADAKIIEIPDKCLAIAETYLKYRPFMLNIMAGACSTGVYESENLKQVDCLKRFAVACARVQTLSCAVTVLTSKTVDIVKAEFHNSPTTQVSYYARKMVQAGMTDIVCSPKESDVVKGILHLTVNTPGVRLPDTDVRDQARVMTPAEALKYGADRLVIGSNLTDGEGDITERIARNYDRLMQHLADN